MLSQQLQLQHQLDLERSARHDLEMHTKVLEQQKAALQEESLALQKTVDDCEAMGMDCTVIRVDILSLYFYQ